MRKMSHRHLLCAGVVLSQLAMPGVYARGNRPLLLNASYGSVTGGHLGKAVHGGIKGHITGPDGAPAAGVNVVFKKTGKGTVTDANGDFSIAANPGDVLLISGVGYYSRSVTVGSGDLSISLKQSEKLLEEVVVTALGVKKQQRAIGYSTTEVDGSKFTQSREVNIGNALTGQVAGVVVSGVATGPSGSSRVVIRGVASIAGNSQPLYVIDGVPYDNTNQGNAGQWGGVDFGDGLSNINPDDVESIQVLKGVAASNLYGFRGGNGAILITTKSGSKSKNLSVELNDNITANNVIDDRDYQYQYGQGVLGVKPTTAAAAQASEYYSWGAKMDGSQTVNFLGNSYNYSPEKDNFKNFYTTGVSNQSSLSLIGSNDKGHFRLGLGDLYLQTFIPNSGMKQQSVNLNTDYKITKRLDMNLTAAYVFENVNNRASFSDAPGNVVASTAYLGNTFDIRWEKPGVTAAGTELLPGTDTYFNNAYFVAYHFQNQTSRNRLTGGLTLKYHLTDWLYAQGAITRDGYIFDLTNITPTGTGYSPGGSLTQTEVNFHELNENIALGVNKKFGGDFSFNALVGANSQDNVSYSYGVNGVGPFVIPYFYSANNVANKPFSYTYDRYHVNSVYGSADIGYKNFLFLTATARNDWFSTLNINTDHYLYPSVSGSFVFSDAFHLPSWISFGKLRASFGEGSNGASPYQNALTYGLQGYTTATAQPIGYVSNTSIPNASLKPVKIQEKEVGVNLEFFRNRLGIDAALYYKKTTDDILPVTVSPTSGYGSDYENIGVMRNKGIELLLTGTPVQARNFTWDVAWNFADNNNKVLSLGEGVPSIVLAGAYPRWGSEVNISAVVGMPYGQIMGFDYTRDAKGNIVYGTNGEPIQTAVKALGSGQYNLTGGLTNTFRYKSFSLSFLLDYKFGAKIYSGTNLLLDYYGLQKNTLQGRESGYIGAGVNQQGTPNTVSVAAQQYWQDISAGGADHIAKEFIYDASFIKLRSLSLGYALPQSLLRGTFIKGVNVSLVGRNLLTLLKHTPNIDPESNYNNSSAQGLELSGYPAIRSLGANVHVNF